NGTGIKGIIIDGTSSTPLEFSTVSLSDSTAKVLAVRTTNEKGEFILTTIPVGEYNLKVSYVGYAELTQPISVTEGQTEIDLGNITIEPDAQQLASVVVTAKRPTIERHVDKLVVNIANTIAADNSTAEELLKKAPGVTIDRDGNVMLNGRAVQVWIDNRPTHLSGQDLVALLSATDGSTIDKIEIIDNPSSKYDAAGSAGIINIRTKKNFLSGFHGNVRTGYTQYLESEDGYFYGANASVNLNYRNDLISTFINYGIQHMEGFAKLTEDVKSENIGYQRYSSTLLNYNYTPQNIKTGIDFFIDKKNTIGLIGGFNLRGGKERDSGFAIVGPRNAPIEESVTIGDNTNSFRNATLNLNYTHLFGENSSHDLTANLDYIYYATEPKQYSHTDFSHFFPPKDTTETFQNNSDQVTQVFSAKIDYTRPINGKMMMEAGGKIGYSRNDSEILRRDFTSTGGWQKTDSLSNAFEYDEVISALYANYSWQINQQWSAKAGLRWENTYTKGTWKSADSLTSQTYNDFFPTLFLGYNPHAMHNLSLSYTRRLQRPNYWQLNPFRRYAGAYTYIQGTSDLSPSYSNNIQLSYTAFQRWNIGMSFSHTKGMIIQVPEFDEDTGETGYVQGNFGQNYMTGIWVSASMLPLAKWWYFTTTVYGSHISNKDGEVNTQSWHSYINVNNTFLLGKTWSAEITGWMQSPTIWGYYDIKAQGSVSAGVKKTFADNKGALSLYLDDIFKTQSSNVTMSREGTVRYAENLWSSRAIRFSFSWRFGTMSAPAKQRKVSQQEEVQRMGAGDSGAR
ncbi:MAG: TonB-dependent receptor, partial [Prevotellaceae bacterium]|nr:TonB-dependent receptor [Prevotellaceae bacterium]